MTDTSCTAAPAALDKTFDPAAIEAKWYAHWEQAGLFRPDRPQAQPFTIVNPPPNVTGSLHIGHALDNTLQDIVVRYERLRGKDALWVVGTDHAGIATQMVVERQLEAQQDKRANYTREQFIEKVWAWKADSGGTITGQLRRLGCSMDWSREQFTMDEHFSRAVVKVFVDLYNEGLIYRDKRLVNWDPKLQTAISDLEVEQREVEGSFWHFRYPLEDGSGYIAIATTRPETILGDGAVAVHPDDPRYRHLVGQRCKLPIVDRLIPVIADDYVKMDFGSGAVKITAAHDQNDYEVYKRHPEAGIPLINLMNADATMSDNCPPAFRGLDRYEARKKVVADFAALGLLDKIEAHKHMVPFGDRSGVVIEPWLTDQWYVDAAELAKAPMAAARDGRIDIVPKTWEKTFFNWMENIQPWCVSRQLWWGHRIPAWFVPNIEKRGNSIRLSGYDFAPGILPTVHQTTVLVAYNEAEMAQQFRKKFGIKVKIKLCDSWEEYRVWMTDLVSNPNHPGRSLQERAVVRDPDVLDTWFSSALWPFATLGWPEDADPPSPSGEGLGVGPLGMAQDSGIGPTPTPPLKGRGLETTRSLLARHYPNDLLVSGFDILFFWCARMAMQGMHFMHEVPWKRLYLHGLVRAADGQKMSKSKGNVVDPLVLIDKYGADALRFFMAAMESQGRDVKMDERRVEGYRNFATKLWNAARFCQSNGIGASTSLAAPAATLAVNRWIIGEVVETLAELDKAMADLRFDAAANAIYHFVWDQFCDWYIELVKGRFDEETKLVAGWVLDQILVMLHPFMPFVTEELWSALGKRERELIVSDWPQPNAAVDAEAKAEIEWLIRVVSGIRSARTEVNVPPSAKLTAWINQPSLVTHQRLENCRSALYRLARLDGMATLPDDGGEGLQVIIEDDIFLLQLDGVIDIAAEKARLTKALETSTKEAESLDGRLKNPAFVEKAKPEAVDKARADHAAHAAEAERLAAALARLG